MRPDEEIQTEQTEEGVTEETQEQGEGAFTVSVQVAEILEMEKTDIIYVLMETIDGVGPGTPIFFCNDRSEMFSYWVALNRTINEFGKVANLGYHVRIVPRLPEML